MSESVHFITFGEYIFLGQMVSVGNYRGGVSSRDKIFHVGPSTHTWGYGKFVNAHYACFPNSNAKLRLCLGLHLDFLPSLRSGKKPAIHPCAFIRPYINSCGRGKKSEWQTFYVLGKSEAVYFIISFRRIRHKFWSELNCVTCVKLFHNFGNHICRLIHLHSRVAIVMPQLSRHDFLALTLVTNFTFVT